MFRLRGVIYIVGINIFKYSNFFKDSNTGLWMNKERIHLEELVDAARKVGDFSETILKSLAIPQPRFVREGFLWLKQRRVETYSRGLLVCEGIDVSFDYYSDNSVGGEILLETEETMSLKDKYLVRIMARISGEIADRYGVSFKLSGVNIRYGRIQEERATYYKFLKGVEGLPESIANLNQAFEEHQRRVDESSRLYAHIANTP